MTQQLTRDEVQVLVNEWTNDLRSGEYTQCKSGHMCAKTDGKLSHCCLAVLLETTMRLYPRLGITRVEQEWDHPYYHMGGDTASLYPSSDMAQAIGLGTTLGAFRPFENLAMKNDQGFPFTDIADIIEEHKEILFPILKCDAVV